jgi:hypothetical protein
LAAVDHARWTPTFHSSSSPVRYDEAGHVAPSAVAMAAHAVMNAPGISAWVRRPGNNHARVARSRTRGLAITNV